MTHDDGAAAVIGGGATVVLVADAVYSASRWGGSFSRTFLLALGGMVVLLVLGTVVRRLLPVVRDRRTARSNQRTINGVAALSLVALLVLMGRYGGNEWGELLGLLAGLACFFVLLGVERLSQAFVADARLARRPGSRKE